MREEIKIIVQEIGDIKHCILFLVVKILKELEYDLEMSNLDEEDFISSSPLSKTCKLYNMAYRGAYKNPNQMIRLHMDGKGDLGDQLKLYKSLSIMGL